MVTVLLIWGVAFILLGFFNILRIIFLTLKAAYIFLFASEETIDLELEKILSDNNKEYAAFENELEEMLKD